MLFLLGTFCCSYAMLWQGYRVFEIESMLLGIWELNWDLFGFSLLVDFLLNSPSHCLKYAPSQLKSEWSWY